MGCRGKGFADRFRCRGWRDSNPSTFNNQLQAFIDRRRTNPVMFNVAHVLSPAMLKALAEHFRDLNPKPLGGGSEGIVAAGKKIYEDGVPSAEVPPCATCHGARCKGR